MSVLEDFFYGLISGLTEFLPVSARGHQSVFHYLFGGDTRASLQDLLVHIGILISILVACWEKITRLCREQKAAASAHRKKTRHLDNRSYYDLRLLKTAILPLFVGLMLTGATENLRTNLPVLMGLFAINGVILLIAEHTRRGNRDARTMSGIDGILMGICGATSVFPGISRTGMILSYAAIRGADGQSSVTWAILLGIPATVFAICYDTFLLLRSGFGTVSLLTILGCISAGIAAFLGGYIGISVLRLVATHDDRSPFAYYAFGVTLFVFILYLLT